MEIFQERRKGFEIKAKAFQQKYNLIANLRLLVFVLSMCLSIYLYYLSAWIECVLVVIFSMPVFIFLLKIHQKIIYQRNHFRFLAQINKNEILRLEGTIAHLPDGAYFEDDGHFYTSDLDIFGHRSLFQLINRTSTSLGEEKLAMWLKAPATKTQIIERQNAVQELSKDIDFGQNLQALGMHATQTNKLKNEALLEWIKEPIKILKSTFWRGIQYIIPVLSIVCISLAFTVDYRFVYLPLVLNFFILRSIFRIVQDAYDKTQPLVKVLQSYSKILEHIENTEFRSTKNQLLKDGIVQRGHKASKEIYNLASIVYYLEQRSNIYFSIVANGFFLWDLHFLLRLEYWKSIHKENVGDWMHAIAEIEALNSFAGFARANPEYHMPIISDKDFYIKAADLGHPLLLQHKRITNSFELEGLGKTMLVTGSNMSGKTTFERTIGINVVLALCGSVVCAKSLELSAIQVFTSMRTQDSLEENVSSFYAELKRLKQLITYLQDNQMPVLYLLDEILKGTNSVDRHQGAKALILQLHQKNASGLVSTHDLDLGALEEETDFVKNYSFSSEIIGEEIIFDYQLKEGICKSFNASKLMQQMGIEIK